MNAVRLEFSQFGHFDSFSIYRSPTPIDIHNLPTPIVTDLRSMFYIDYPVFEGTYYYLLASHRGTHTVLSEVFEVNVVPAVQIVTVIPARVEQDDPISFPIELDNHELVTDLDVIMGSLPSGWELGDGELIGLSTTLETKTFMLQATDILQNVATKTYNVEVVTKGDPRWNDVVCLLRFDGNVTDLKGNSWYGSNMAYDTGRFGRGFRASQNLGTRHAYSATSLATQLLNTSFTVEFWVKYLEHNGQYGGLVTNRNTGSNYSWAITTLVNTGCVRFEVDGIGALQTTEELPLGEFIHVAIELDRERKELRGFFNGRLVGRNTFTSTSALNNIGYPIRIGALNSSGNFRPEAIIDEVRITKNGCRYITEFEPPIRMFPNFLPLI